MPELSIRGLKMGEGKGWVSQRLKLAGVYSGGQRHMPTCTWERCVVCGHEYVSECVCSVCMPCNLSFGSFLKPVVEVSCFLPVVCRLDSSSSHMLSKCSVSQLLSSPGYDNCFSLLPDMSMSKHFS